MKRILFIIMIFLNYNFLFSIEYINIQDEKRMEELLSLQDKMREELATCRTQTQLEETINLYSAKAHNIFNRPIQIKYNYDERITNLIFEIKSILIKNVEIDPDSHNIEASLEITIILINIVQFLSGTGLNVTIDNIAYRVERFLFVDISGAILFSTGLFHAGITPIPPGTVDLVETYPIPILDLINTHQLTFR